VSSCWTCGLHVVLQAAERDRCIPTRTEAVTINCFFAATRRHVRTIRAGHQALGAEIVALPRSVWLRAWAHDDAAPATEWEADEETLSERDQGGPRHLEQAQSRAARWREYAEAAGIA